MEETGMFLALPLIVIILFIAALGAISDAAKRRGRDPWRYVVVAAVGVFTFAGLSAMVWGSGPELPVAIGWLGVVYASVFVLSSGKRHGQRGPWQCPQCHLFNEPSTLYCNCGEPAPSLGADAPSPAAHPGRRIPKLVLGVWPEITDLEFARWAADQGVLGAGLVSFFRAATLVLGLLGMAPREAVLQAAVSMTAYALIGFGIRARFRLAAVLALTMYASGLALQRLAGVVVFPLLPLFIVALLVGGVRGAFAFHRYSKAGAELPNEAASAHDGAV
jgi:hypothetical protein